MNRYPDIRYNRTPDLSGRGRSQLPGLATRPSQGESFIIKKSFNNELLNIPGVLTVNLPARRRKRKRRRKGGENNVD